MKANFKMSLLLAALALIDLVYAQPPEVILTNEQQNAQIYEGLIAGVGKGTFAIVICMFISVTCCFFKGSVVYPNVCITCAILFPVITFLFIYLCPKESLASDKT